MNGEWTAFVMATLIRVDPTGLTAEQLLDLEALEEAPVLEEHVAYLTDVEFLRVPAVGEMLLFSESEWEVFSVDHNLDAQEVRVCIVLGVGVGGYLTTPEAFNQARTALERRGFVVADDPAPRVLS